MLPVYGARLGGDPASIGYFLSLTYLSLALGTLAAGGVSDRFRKTKTSLLVCGISVIPLIWLLGLAPNIVVLTLVYASVAFLAGMALTFVSIITGLFSEKGKRGRTFGLLTLNGPLGAIIGGLTIGPLADNLGFYGLFTVLALFTVLLPMASLFVREPGSVTSNRHTSSVSNGPSSFGWMFYLFLASSVAANTALFLGRLGTSLSMRALGFDSGAITSTAAAGGFATLPLPLLFGAVSDRIGRKYLILACYLSTVAGLLVLLSAVQLWHFWLAAGLLSLTAYVSIGVGSAFATDVVPSNSLGKSLSLFGATIWAGAIAGFTLAGSSLQLLGMSRTLAIGGSLGLAASVALLFVRETRKQTHITTPLTNPTCH